MVFSRYLYSKVKEAKSVFVKMLLNDQELYFLEKYDIHFFKSTDKESYWVNSEELKVLFCN